MPAIRCGQHRDDAEARAHRPWSAPAALVQSEQSADALTEVDPAQEGAKSLTAMTRGVKLRPRAA